MRKHTLAECNGTFAAESDGRLCYVIFDCPEGHEDCRHVIPFTPALDGSAVASPQQNGAVWQRAGDTVETLTLSPSIRRIPRYQSREEAISAGCIAEYVTPTLLCALHIFIRNGRIEFCGDSR